jgi:hypothetical protein
MNNKYDFTEQEAEQLLNILHPTVSAIEMNIADLIEAMEELGMDTEAVTNVADKLINLEFIDEFESMKNDWKEISESFFTKVMNVQIVDDLGNPYFVFMQYFQVDELMTQLDEFIIGSQKRLKIEHKQIKTVDEFRTSLIEKAREVSRDVLKLFDRDDALNIFSRQWTKIVEEKNLSEVENIIFDFIIAFEEYNSASEIENERFWNDKVVKLAYELINRTLALISFNNFLDEFNFDEETIDD